MVREYRTEDEAAQARFEMAGAASKAAAGDDEGARQLRATAAARRWQPTRRARALYEAMGFKPRAPPAEVGEYDADCIDYMVASDADVAAAACDEGDWVWLRGDKVRVRPVKAGKRGCDKRAWWEVEAMAALHTEHDAATGGDGLRQMSMLMPNEGEHFYMLAMLPRLEAKGGCGF